MLVLLKPVVLQFVNLHTFLDNALYIKDNIEVGCSFEVSEFIKHLLSDVCCFDFRLILFGILAKKLFSGCPFDRPIIDMTSTHGLAGYFATGLKADIVTKSDEDSSEYPQFGFAWVDDLLKDTKIRYKLAFVACSGDGANTLIASEFILKNISNSGFVLFGTASNDGAPNYLGNLKNIREMHAFMPPGKLAETNKLMQAKAKDCVIDWFVGYS